MSFRPFYFNYLINTFHVHLDDNVQHIEIRSLVGTNGLGDLFDFNNDGSSSSSSSSSIMIYSGDEVVDTYRQALTQFQEEVSDGFTMKLIISSLRVLDPETIEVRARRGPQKKSVPNKSNTARRSSIRTGRRARGSGFVHEEP